MNKKVLASLGLAVALVATSMPALAATDVEGGHDISIHYGNVTGAEVCAQQTVNQDEGASCTVYAEVGSQFTVTIPKSITLSGETKSGEYTVSCVGDIAGDEYVLVKPDASFEMKQDGKDKVTATVTQATTMFRGDNYVDDLVDGEAKMATGATGSIDAQGLTAGAWNGTFNFNIALEEDTATNN